jgi:PIN domain nuclease of toxin-antitoxin system
LSQYSSILAKLQDVNQNHGHLLDFYAIMQELQQAAQFVFVPFDIDDVFAYADLSAIPGNRDRLIVTACRKMDAPLITVDQAIIDSGVVEVIQ